MLSSQAFGVSKHNMGFCGLHWIMFILRIYCNSDISTEFSVSNFREFKDYVPFKLPLFIQLRIVTCSAWHPVHCFLGLLFFIYYSFLLINCSLLYQAVSEDVPGFLYGFCAARQIDKTEFCNLNASFWLKNWKFRLISCSGFIWSSFC